MSVIRQLTPISSWDSHLPDGVRIDSEDFMQADALTSNWVAILKRQPDRELLCNADGQWMTRGEFLKLTEVLAYSMNCQGLTRGDRIILSAAASKEMAAFYVAALRLGLVVVPVNTAYTRTEIAHIVTDVKPSAAIVDSAERASWITDACTLPALKLPFLGPGSELPLAKDKFVVFNPRVPVADTYKPCELDRADHSTPALIVYTSGTTGKPKGAIVTHGNLLATAKSLNIAWRWTESDRLILALPLFHMHGLGVGINGTLCAGSSAVLLSGFDPDSVTREARDKNGTMFFGVPTMYQRLLETPSFDSFKSLRLLVSGSAPLAARLHREIEDRIGQVVLERYGTTESLINISNPYSGERRPGSVGLPLPGVSVALGDDGEIFISGPTVFNGYLSNEEATAQALSDRWFATGDIGEVGEDEYISIVGRKKDLIISGGYNVYPREVEEALRSHPAVKDVAVVGKASTQWGEVVAAFVIRASNVTEPQLIDHVSLTLAKYKRPKVIVFCDEFPRNALGKVLSGELRSQLQD